MRIFAGEADATITRRAGAAGGVGWRNYEAAAATEDTAAAATAAGATEICLSETLFGSQSSVS